MKRGGGRVGGPNNGRDFVDLRNVANMLIRWAREGRSNQTQAQSWAEGARQKCADYYAAKAAGEAS